MPGDDVKLLVRIVGINPVHSLDEFFLCLLSPFLALCKADPLEQPLA